MGFEVRNSCMPQPWDLVSDGSPSYERYLWRGRLASSASQTMRCSDQSNSLAPPPVGAMHMSGWGLCAASNVIRHTPHAWLTAALIARPSRRRPSVAAAGIHCQRFFRDRASLGCPLPPSPAPSFSLPFPAVTPFLSTAPPLVIPLLLCHACPPRHLRRLAHPRASGGPRTPKTVDSRVRGNDRCGAVRRLRMARRWLSSLPP